jgi:hypothetical protein
LYCVLEVYTYIILRVLIMHQKFRKIDNIPIHQSTNIQKHLRGVNLLIFSFIKFFQFRDVLVVDLLNFFIRLDYDVLRSEFLEFFDLDITFFG